MKKLRFLVFILTFSLLFSGCQSKQNKIRDHNDQLDNPIVMRGGSFG